jgi:hypothetical protein
VLATILALSAVLLLFRRRWVAATFCVLGAALVLLLSDEDRRVQKRRDWSS